ncbi:MAG: hypothetical protein KF774_05700 [Planctomyces sp.]|nr:hypothetical protein [Planctomyces sp.]
MSVSVAVAAGSPGRPSSPACRADVRTRQFAPQEPGMSRDFEELTPQNFSFNSPLGWCPSCQGLGVEQGTNISALIPNPDRSLRDGAVLAWPDPKANPLFAAMLDAISEATGLPLDVPYRQLEPRLQRVVLYGCGDRWLDARLPGSASSSPPALPKQTVTPTTEVDAAPDGDALEAANPSPRPTRASAARRKRKVDDAPETATASPPSFRFQYKGLYPAIEEATRVSFEYRQSLSDLVGETTCSACQGTRIREDAAAVKLRGLTLPQICQMPLREALEFLQGLQLEGEERKIAGDLLQEVTHRLKFLVDVGLDYLTLDRPMPTLSGGESQRIRLAGQIGRALTGVLYVLDEPTIGLHPRDNQRLIDALRRLRDLGNTVVLVEHDREVLDAADRLYDFGPGSGRHGGQVVASGAPREFVSGQVEGSLTADYLSARKVIPIPKTRRMIRRQPVANPPPDADPPPPPQRKARRPARRAKSSPT